MQDLCCEVPDYGTLIIFGTGSAHIHFRTYEELEQFRQDPIKQYYMDRAIYTDFTRNTISFILGDPEK